MVDIGQLNPFRNLDIGGIGAIGSALLIFAISIAIIVLVGVLIFLYLRNKQFKYKIPLTKKVGNNTIRIGIFKARDFKIGRAGDKLWYVAKAKKFISPATLQTASNEYTHHEREDGEWINVSYPDVDETMKKFGVKYVSQDMRAGRIAISDILEARFRDKKTFWEQWGNMIMQLMFFMITAVLMIIIFYQWGDIVTKVSTLVGQLKQTQADCGGGSIVPALIMLSFRRRK